jgi:uncharacterized iron-regulated membrane protein
MCICCAAVPVAAATGLSLDKKQRKHDQVQGRTRKRVRPFMLLTILAILVLNVGSVIIHTRYYQLGL